MIAEHSHEGVEESEEHHSITEELSLSKITLLIPALRQKQQASRIAMASAWRVEEKSR